MKGISKRTKKPAVLDADQCWKLISLLPEPYRTMVLVAICTGLRVSEILTLRWRRIDFERQLMMVEFLETAKQICPEYAPLFMVAARAGLRRGELVALQWGDIEFGRSDYDSNRYILVQHNYVRREHTSTKSRKTRRVDLSRELRRVLLDIRTAHLKLRGLTDHAAISTDLVFPSPNGRILDPDNLYHRFFVPVLKKSGIRKIRLHDLRHTFGSLLIQHGASIVFVRDQMGHSSIQITVDTYGHLVPGADVSYIDRLDESPEIGET